MTKTIFILKVPSSNIDLGLRIMYVPYVCTYNKLVLLRRINFRMIK